VMPVVVNTELGSGLQRSRGIRKVEPQEVASGIVQALQTGRVDVWVPRSVAGLFRSNSVVPRAVADAVTRALKGDRVLVDPDHVQRAAYEHRTAEDASPTPAGPDALPVEQHSEAKQAQTV
jgi:hypothetical protein